VSRIASRRAHTDPWSHKNNRCRPWQNRDVASCVLLAFVNGKYELEAIVRAIYLVPYFSHGLIVLRGLWVAEDARAASAIPFTS